ncbi:MAG TPA: hypothetical protein HA263_09795 [Methanoregulaceae archaeon]|nr:hypothetical protein [Methanoregulaceae archaeon]
MLYWNDRSTPNLTQGSVTDAFLDRDGSVLECRDLNASLAVARTADGGYVSVGIPFGEGAGYSDFGWAPTSAFHTLRFDSTGALAWNRALPVGLISQVRKIVPTADGGYAVLALRTNE